MADAGELTKVFMADIERITDDFIRCFGLTFDEQVPSLSYRLYRWVDFVLRYVEPVPRRVAFSRGFWRRTPEDLVNTVESFVEMVRDGHDINPYQGRGLTSHDVSSGKSAQRTDLLWADWSVHHFHLTAEPIAPGDRYSKRSQWLLFALVFRDALFCIDVQHHPKGAGFAEPDLLALAIKSWPTAFEHYRAKGVTGGDWGAEDIHKMRKGGCNVLHKVGSDAYMSPGGGITGAATPIQMHLWCDKIQIEIEDLARQFADPQGAPAKLCRDSGILNPDFHVVFRPEGAVVYEESVRTVWSLSGWPGIALLAPQWAIARLAASTQ